MTFFTIIIFLNFFFISLWRIVVTIYILRMDIFLLLHITI